MRRPKGLACVLLVVAAAMVLSAYAVQDKSSVVLEIGLPNGSTPQLRIADGETGTVTVPGIGSYGFVPALRAGTVAVELFDLNRTPHRRLALMEATIGGGSVRSETDPEFTVRVIKVLAP